MNTMMLRARLTSGVRTLARIVAVVVMLPWAYPALPAQADDHIGPVGPRPVLVEDTSGPTEPATRLQVIVKTVNVANDRDGIFSGAGDMLLTASFWQCPGANPPCSASDRFPAVLLAEAQKSFNADSGDAVNLNRVMPLAGDVKNATFAAEDRGIDVYASQRYLLQISIFERDFSGGDYMGGVQRVIHEGNDWGIGVHTREPAGELADTSMPYTGPLCAGCGGIIVGDFLVTYEIRRTALPDMHPKSARIVMRPDEKQPRMCAVIENLGSEAAGNFSTVFIVDGQTASTFGSGGLAAGQSREYCHQVQPLDYGQHSLQVHVDRPREFPELDETNNVLSQTYVRRVIDDVVAPVTGGVLDPGPSGEPGPILTAPAPRADLQVTSIQARGKSSSGKNDCDPGRNDVTVRIKNQGTPAANVAVRLTVDGRTGQSVEKTIPSLDAGDEEGLTFESINLDKGDHALTARVDSKAAVSESNEGNNELTVQVSCKDES